MHRFRDVFRVELIKLLGRLGERLSIVVWMPTLVKFVRAVSMSLCSVLAGGFVRFDAVPQQGERGMVRFRFCECR